MVLVCSEGAVIRIEMPREVAKTPGMVSLRRGLGAKFCQPICTNIYEKKYKRNDAKGHIDITKCHHGRCHSKTVKTPCLSRALWVGNRAQSSTRARLPPQRRIFGPLPPLRVSSPLQRRCWSTEGRCGGAKPLQTPIGAPNESRKATLHAWRSASQSSKTRLKAVAGRFCVWLLHM